MTYYVNVIDEQGHYELIDSEFMALYPDLDFTTMPKLTDKQYQTYLTKANGKERFVNGKFVYEQIKVDMQAVLENQKSAKREEINRKRDEVCFGGIYIDVLDKWFDTDQTSFVKMIGAKAVMDDDFSNGQEIQPELWICADNSVVQLNRDDLALIIRSIKKNVSNMHAVAVQHKMQLEQAENPLEYDYSGGWTKTYADYLEEQANV